MIKLRLNIHRILLSIMLMVIAVLPVSNANAAKITGLRIGQGVGNVRIVFDADSKFDYKVFTLSAPNRLVIDTQGVDVSSAVSSNKDENVFVNENFN